MAHAYRDVHYLERPCFARVLEQSTGRTASAFARVGCRAHIKRRARLGVFREKPQCRLAAERCRDGQRTQVDPERSYKSRHLVRQSCPSKAKLADGSAYGESARLPSLTAGREVKLARSASVPGDVVLKLLNDELLLGDD